MKKILTIFSILMIYLNAVQAQEVTYSSVFDDVEPGQQVCVDIQVDNFTNMLNSQFTIHWDTDVLEYVSVNEVPNGLANLSTSFGFSQTGIGNLITAWVAPMNEPYTFNNGNLGTAYQICFNAVGEVGESTTIDFTENPQEFFAVQEIDGVETVIDLQFEVGTTTIVNPTMALPFATSISTETVNEGDNVCVDINVANFEAMINMDYTLTWNSSLLSFTGINIGSLGLSGFTMANFNTSSTAAGDLGLEWNSGTPVSISNGTLYQVCFEAVGDGGAAVPIVFSNDVVGIDVQNEDGTTPLNGTNGLVTIQTVNNDLLTFLLSDECSPGPQLCVSLTAENFNDVGNVQFPVSFDHTVLQFDSIVLPIMPLSNLSINGSFNTNPPCDGQVNFAWQTGEIFGADLDPEDVIWTMCFTVLDPSAGPSNITMGSGCGSLVNEVTTAFGIDIPYSIDDEGIESFTGCSDNVVTVNTTNVDCNGNNTGSIVLTSSETGCTYAWAAPLAGETSSTVTELIAGTYTVTVTCDGEEEVIIIMVTQPQPLGYTVNNTVDNNCSYDSDGQITLIPTGGTSTYNVTWTGPGNPGPGNIISNLPNGTYTPTVTDANNCVFEGTPITISSLSNLGVSLNVISLPISNDGVVEAVVTGAVGAPADWMYTWDPYTDTDNQVDNAEAGPISVTVTDAAGCSASANTVLTNQTSDIVIESFDVTNALACNGDCNGELTVMASGGNGDYSYEWSANAAGETSNVASGLCAGVYIVTISDSANNTIATQTLTLTEPDALGLSFVMTSATGADVADGGALATVTGGVTDYDYLWSDANATTVAQLENVLPGFYTLTVTDANMCEVTDVVEVVLGEDPDCYKFNRVVTANGDSKNDFFVISCAETTNNTLEIFNRWGQRVYNVSNYANSWEGLSESGSELYEGGYFFVFAYTDVLGENQVIKGSINLLRK